MPGCRNAALGTDLNAPPLPTAGYVLQNGAEDGRGQHGEIDRPDEHTVAAPGGAPLESD